VDNIWQNIYTSGVLMPEEYSYLNYVKISNPNIKNPLLVDVGVAVGDFTQAFLDRFPDAFIVGFDPDMDALMEITKRFPYSPSIRLIDVGLGNNFKDNVLFYKFRLNSGCSSIYRRDDIQDQRGMVEARIKIIPLDSVKIFKDIFYLKLDVEGAEFDALMGAKNYIESKKIKYIQLEYGSSYFNANIELNDVVKFLYPYYIIYNEKFDILPDTYNLTDGVVRNFLAVLRG
jgi:FkbM family methyltransferase